MAKDRLSSELLAQYRADYGGIRDDDPNGWPLAELKAKIQSVINNADLKRGSPPPIRARTEKALVVKRPPQSAWERRVKVAQDFPERMTSREVYDRLGLDCQKAGDKRAVSRVMRAAGFAAKRGRRCAIWKKVRNDGVNSAGSGAVASLLTSPSPPHIILIVSLSLLIPCGSARVENSNKKSLT